MPNSSAYAGRNIWQYSTNGTTAQSWEISWEDGAFIFKTALGDYALSLSGLTSTSNAQLAKLDSTSDNQRFLLKETTMTQATVADLIAVLDEYAKGNDLVVFKTTKSLSQTAIDRIYDAMQAFWDIGTSVGFTMIDLTTGCGITYNSDRAYSSACTIKGPYSIALTQYVPSALWDYESDFYPALNISDNETYKEYFYHYGTWPLENYNEIGHVENFSWTGWTAYYSAEDLCRMWVVSQEHLMDDSAESAWLRDVLSDNSATMTRYGIGKYHVGPVYAKSGWHETARTEGCYVTNNGHPYVCAIMSTTNLGHSDLVEDLAEAIYLAHEEIAYY